MTRTDPASLSPTGPERRPGRPPVVLVVDDDDAVRRVLGIGLQHWGFDVRLSASGREAVEVYRSCGGYVDMVLLDVLMPDRDGVWTLSALRALDARVQACFVTGDCGRYTEQDLLDLSVRAVFHKPVNLGALADRLARMIDRDRPEAGAAEVVTTTSRADGTAACPYAPVISPWSSRRPR